MLFQVLSPVVSTINADSLNEAIKNYVKFNHNLRINQLLIKDHQNNSYRAKVRYYVEGLTPKVGIDVYSTPTIVSGNTAIPINYGSSITSSLGGIPPTTVVSPINMSVGPSTIGIPVGPVLGIPEKSTFAVNPGIGVTSVAGPPLGPVAVLNTVTPITMVPTGGPPFVTSRGSSFSATDKYIFYKR
jgi:hypothetical protein